MGRLSKTGDEGGQVAKGLTERCLKDLDPSVVDFAKAVFWAWYLTRAPIFCQVSKADAVISDIIISLDKGKTVLKNDNTTLEIEQQTLRELTKSAKEIQLGMLMDAEIESQVEAAKIRQESEDKIRFITEEVLLAPARDGPRDAGREPAGDHGY